MLKKIIFANVLALSIVSCNKAPKVIEAEKPVQEVHQDAKSSTAEVHNVIIVENLQTKNYTYLKVSENGETHWIAAPKMEAEIGATYYYTGGLKKTDFRSTELNRIFDVLYLVSSLYEIPYRTSNKDDKTKQRENASVESNKTKDSSTEVVTIATLLNNSKQYDGKTIRVKGWCVKVNKMIMNRNWVHLKDGSLKEENQDLTITTLENIPLNTEVTMEGKITLNKDFGAGYTYAIIMEEARRIQ